MKRLTILIAALAAASLACTFSVNLPNIRRIETGPTETLEIREALPEGQAAGEVTLELPAGSLRLAGGAAVSLLRLRRNQGKAAALNAGIDNAKGDIIVFTDSDSRLSPSSLRQLVGWFARPTVGAVAGRVVLSAHRTWLARWQSIEYLFGQQVQKLAQAGSGSSITVCPGPVCAFRRDALIGLGGVKARTLVEDFDLTLEAVSAGWEVIYEPRAQAWTRAPDTLRELLRQRVRWSRGTLQTLREHRRLILSPATGALGMFWLPYYLVIGFGGVLFELVVLLTLPFLVAASGAPLHTLGVGLAYLLLVESLVAAQYLFVLLLEGGEARRLAPAALLMKPYHLVLAWTRLVAMVREYRGDPHRWSA